MRQQPSRETRRKGISVGEFHRWSLSAASLALIASLFIFKPATAQPATCVVSGQVLDIGANPVANTNVRFRVISPTPPYATQDLTTKTDVSGNWSLTLVQGLNAQVDIPAVGIAKDTVIPTGASCPAAFTALTLYNRGTLTPATILSTTGPSMGGDLTGSSPNPSVIALRGQPLAVGACTNGQARVYSSASGSYTCQAVVNTGVTSVSGGTGITVSGTAQAPIVGITAGGVTNTQLGTGAAAANVGSLSGALSGTLPSPSLASGAAATNVGALGGDLSGTLPSPTVASVGTSTAANLHAAELAANAATASNTPSTIVKRDGSGNFTIGTITGALVGNASTATTLSSTLTGDASSTGNAVTVTGLRGRSVSNSAPTNGYALTWNQGANQWEAQAAVGTVTSVSAAGGGTGLSFSGSPITGAGTLTLQGTLGIGFGGTGQTTITGAFNALSPMASLGDIIYGGAAGAGTRLTGNTSAATQFLASIGTGAIAQAPAWRAIAAGDLPGTINANTTGSAASLSVTVPIASGGTGQTSASGAFNALSPTTTTGDLIYANGTGTNTRLAGNTTATKNFLTSTGAGGLATAPAWGTIASADLPASIASNTSGTAAGLSATLAVASGGTGAGTFSAGILHASGTNAFTSAPVALAADVSGTLPIGNGGTGQTSAAAAYNALSPTTTLGDLAYANGTGTNTRLAGNTTTTKKFLRQTGDGANSAAPAWDVLVAGDIPNLPASQITSGTIDAARLPALAGDVTGAPGANTVAKIQGNAVLSGTPTNGQIYQYVTANNRFEPTTLTLGSVTSVSGSGGTTGLTLTGGPITGVGTLTLGGTLAIANGGTGAASKAAAFDALQPMSTLGDVVYGGAAGTGTRLAGNTSSTPMFLKSTGSAGNATAPAWNQVAMTDLTGTLGVANGGTGATTLTGYVKGNGASAFTAQAVPIPVSDGGSGATTLTGVLHGNGTGAFTAANVALGSEVTGTLPTANGGTNKAAWTTGSIPYLSSATTFNEDNTNLFYDGTNHRVGLGTTVPDTRLTFAAGDQIHFFGSNPIIYTKPASPAATTLNLSAVATATSPGYLSNGASMRLADDGTGQGTILLGTNATERMRIDSTGNIGIGTASPTSLLHVTGLNLSGPIVDLYNTGDGIGDAQTLRVTAASGTGIKVESSGTVAVGINVTGSTNGNAITATSGANSNALAAIAASTSSVPISVWATNGQTADLVQMKDYAGNSLGGFTATGNFYTGGVAVGGASEIHGQAMEELTLNTGGTTTDTSANLLPANSIIKAVTVRVTESITVASAFKVGDATISGRFLADGTGLAAGSTGVGLVHIDQTGTSGPRQTTAAKVRVTTTGTPGAGKVRIVVFYETFTAPTS